MITGMVLHPLGGRGNRIDTGFYEYSAGSCKKARLNADLFRNWPY